MWICQFWKIHINGVQEQLAAFMEYAFEVYSCHGLYCSDSFLWKDTIPLCGQTTSYYPFCSAKQHDHVLGSCVSGQSGSLMPGLGAWISQWLETSACSHHLSALIDSGIGL